jgi:hypothetical protein
VNSQQTLYIWLLFNLGVVTNLLFQAWASIKATSNSIKNFREWWQYNWKDLGWRLAIDGTCWMLWMVGPSFLGTAAAKIIPPASFVIAPWVGFSADRFTNSLGFILRFTTTEMPHVAPSGKG